MSRAPSLLQPKKGGGISFNSTVTLTQCSEKLVQLILHEYSILPKAARDGPEPSGQGPGDSRQERGLVAPDDLTPPQATPGPSEQPPGEPQ